FLRRHNISEKFLASWHQETESKREFLNRLFPAIEKAPKGIVVIQNIASSLADQDNFPDLKGWSDYREKQQAAKEAVDALRHCIGSNKDKDEIVRAREERQKANLEQIDKNITKRKTLEAIQQDLTDLTPK